MTTNDQLIEILKNLSKVLKVIKNEPEYILPSRHHRHLKVAIHDCLYALEITKEQIRVEEYRPEDSIEHQNPETMFDTGLNTKAQMDFKYGIIKQLFDELSEHINFPSSGDERTVEIEGDNKQFYSKYISPDFNVETSDSDNYGRSYTWIKRKGKEALAYIPKLQKYIKATQTITSSISKVYGIQEKVSEALGIIGVGITMTNDANDYFTKKSKK